LATLAFAKRRQSCATWTAGFAIVFDASGLPVAGYPVQGPIDIVGTDGHGGRGELHQPVGALDENLDVAIGRALLCNRQDCARYGRGFNWDAATDQFVAALAAAMANEELIAA